ncbi:hypothetical protein EXIGLDRAFT_761445, partial [Exidia glandulosa HHB12029]
MDAIAEANKARSARKATAGQLQDTVESPRVLKGSAYVFEARKASSLSAAQRNAVWDIFADNMRQSYTASSFGWDPPQKKREMFHTQARFVLARPAESKDADVLAFSTFRFESEENVDGVEEPVLYCYELQVSRRVK